MSTHTRAFRGVAGVVGLVAGLVGCADPDTSAPGEHDGSGERVASETVALQSFSVLDDGQKRAELLSIIQNYLTIAEGTWTTPSEVPEATGYFAAGGAGVEQFRGEAGLAYAYATLLYASPDTTTTFTDPQGHQFSRATLENHLWQTIRHLCYTNRFERTTGSWGGPFTDPHDEGSIGAFELGWASHVYGLILARRGLNLDQDTAAATRTVVTTQADQLLPALMVPGTKSGGDTRAEENAWHSAVLALAAAVYDPDPHNAQWDHEAKNYAINASSRAADEQDTTRIDGSTVADWVTTTNLSDDFTLTNHGIFHPVYSQGVLQNLFDDQLFYHAVTAGIPGAFSFRLREIWEQVLAPLTTSDGDLLMPAGTDWVTHDYQHIPFLAGIATRLSRDDASVFESRAIETLAARQTAGHGSLYGHTQIGYETDVIRNIAQAWWIHNQFGPTSTPTQAAFEQASATWDGTKHWTDPESERKIMVNRGRNALVSMSWAEASGLTTTHPTGLVVPSSEGHLDDPVLVQYWAQSGVGTATGDSTYTCDCRPAELFFSTAGVVGTSTGFFSLTTWADGTTIELDRGTQATFVAAFETAPGLAGPRPVYATSGSQNPGTIGGNWVNVADRFGMAARGQLGFLLEDFADTNSRPIIDNPHRRLEVSGDATPRNRGALILPNATSQATALASVDVDLSGVSDANWSGLSGRAPDGTGRLALARWGGAGSATLTLTSSRGAPIPDRPNDVNVSSATGSTSFSLASPASTGFKAYFWLTTTSSLVAHPISETLVRITNGSGNQTVTARYAGGVAPLSTTQRSLTTGQVVFAKAFDDGVGLVAAFASSTTAGQTADKAFDGSVASSSYWESAPVTSLTTSPQDLRLDFGRLVDVGGVTQTPSPNAGPRDYVYQTSTDGVNFVNVAGGSVLSASATAATTTTFTSPLRTRHLQIHVTRGWASGTPSSVRVTELAVNAPTLDLDAVSPQLDVAQYPEFRLARNGFAQATLRLTNRGNSDVTGVALSVIPPASVTASVNPSSVNVPAHGSVDVALQVRGSSTTPVTGAATLTVNASGVASETLSLLYTDNLALNDRGAPFPIALESSEDPAYLYPARLANDGDTTGSSNFWVSGVAVLGTDPQCLTLDLGASTNVGRVVMVPRTNYGPKDYKIQVSSANTSCLSESGWTTTDTRTSVANGTTISSSFAPLAARYVRLRVTNSWAPGNPPPPYQTQVRELALYPQ